MISKEDRLKFFVNELDEIKDKKKREFAEDLIANADEYFFTIAASTSGKYHPQFDLGDGGLVRHTRCVAFFALCEAESRCFSDEDRDLIIISALAHDMKKLGDGRGKHTVPDHPKWAAEYVWERYEATKLLTKKEAMKVQAAVYAHMGKWGAEDGMPMPNNEFEKSLQSADYIASRKELLGFDFKPTEKVVIVEEQKAPGDFMIDFGKKSGKTIKEIYQEEEGNLSRGYLMWMLNMKDFNKVEARNAAMLYLNEIGKLPESFYNEVANIKSNETKKEITEQPIIMKETNPEDDLPF